MLSLLDIVWVWVGIRQIGRVQRSISHYLKYSRALKVVSYVLCYHDTIFGFPSEGLPDFSDVHEGLLDRKAGL